MYTHIIQYYILSCVNLNIQIVPHVKEEFLRFPASDDFTICLIKEIYTST